MSWGHIASLPVVYVALGAALVIVLWPTEPAGRRVLVRWGIGRPTPEQSRTVASYLLVRRLLYVALFVVIPPVVAVLFPALAPPGSDFGILRLFLPLAAALLLAEAVAAVRQVRGVRVAVLAPRGWRDLVPVWAIALLLGLAALGLVLAGLGLAAQSWADRVAAWFPPNGPNTFVSDGYRVEITQSTSWFALGGILLCLATVLALVRLAVRRHTVVDPAVDAVLRARTACVAVGIGMGWLASMTIMAANRLGFLASLSTGAWPGQPEPPAWLPRVSSATGLLGLVVIFVAAAGWIWVANPPARARDRVGTE